MNKSYIRHVSVLGNCDQERGNSLLKAIDQKDRSFMIKNNCCLVLEYFIAAIKKKKRPHTITSELR